MSQEVILLDKVEFVQLTERLELLTKRLTELEKLLDTDIKTGEAMKITGVSRRTLENERDRPGTVIIYKKVGRAVFYSRQSLIEYNKSKRLRSNR